MKHTIARKKFKQNFGNANQFLVTSRVAFYCLKSSDWSEAPEALHTTWSPLDRDGTISRSQNFIKKTFLAWAVDNIDMYLSLLNREPKYLQKESEQLILNQAKRSVYKKTINLGYALKVNPVIISLLDVLITWRNNSLHTLAKNTILTKSFQQIKGNTSFISENFRGLDPSSLPEKAHSGSNLTFKETASLINVAHKYVEELDRKIISNLDMTLFATSAIARKIQKSKEFARKYSSLQGKKREKMVRVWLQNNLSYSDPTKEVITSCCNKSVIEGADNP